MTAQGDQMGGRSAKRIDDSSRETLQDGRGRKRGSMLPAQKKTVGGRADGNVEKMG